MTTELIKLIPKGTVFKVHYCNDVYMGEIYQEIDGWYVFDPDRSHGGFWDYPVLEALVNKLKDMNKGYEKGLEKYFESCK